jgi:hypothetical protein
MKPLEPTPYQSTCMTVPQEFNLLLCGGRGGGKSIAALLMVLRHCEQYGDQARPLIVRETYKSAQELYDQLDLLLGQAYGKGVRANKAEHVFRLPNGAIIEVGQLANANDYKKYQGRSFSLLVVDEFGLLADRRYVTMLKSNLRSGDGIPLREIRTANPGGSQHQYLHSAFIAKERPWRPFEVDGEVWVCAPSTYRDNPHLDGNQYLKRLAAACANDPDLLRAWETGDWNINRGAFFAGTYDERIHRIGQWNIPVTKEWRSFLAHDYGSSAPSCTLLFVKSPGIQGFPYNSLIAIDEFATYDRNDLNQGLNYPVGKLAECILEMCDKWHANRYGVGDDAYGLNNETLLQVFADHGVDLERPYKKSRVAGWAAVREMLHNARERNGKPGLWISERCTYLLATLPFIERDPARPEDILTTGPDHGLDALRYGVVYHADQSSVVRNERNDPRDRYIHPLAYPPGYMPASY